MASDAADPGLRLNGLWEALDAVEKALECNDPEIRARAEQVLSGVIGAVGVELAKVDPITRAILEAEEIVKQAERSRLEDHAHLQREVVRRRPVSE